MIERVDFGAVFEAEPGSAGGSGFAARAHRLEVENDAERCSTLGKIVTPLQSSGMERVTKERAKLGFPARAQYHAA